MLGAVKIGVSMFLAISMLGNPATATATAAAADHERLDEAKNDHADAGKFLAELRGMRFSGEAPSLNGFSPTQEINLSPPPGSNVYKTAYKSKSNCVVFFSPLGKVEHDLAVKWDGAKCNGKPIQGKGELAITYRTDASDGTFSHVFVYRGRFKDGMLTGPSEKVNFVFYPDGRLKDDIYAFSGEFAYGLLNGAGAQTWTGPATDEPSAWVKKGNFKDGIPSGLITLSRLHPFAGVEADSGEQVLNADGGAYSYQWYNNGKKPVKGIMYFYNDPIQWQIATSEIKTGEMPGHAGIRRVDGSSELLAECDDWDIQKGRWSCARGTAAIASSARPDISLDGAFYIPVPVNKSGGMIRAGNGGRVRIGSENISAGHEMLCNEALSLCHGKAIVTVGAYEYWWGESEFSNGNLQPVSATLYHSSSPYEVDPSKDKKLAVCEEFSSPTRCDRGALWAGDGISWRGGYTMHGVKYSSSAGYDIGSGWGLYIDGHGRLTWGKDGRWAEGDVNDNEWVSIDDCDEPASSSKFICELHGNTVTFVEQRQRSYNSDSNSYGNPYGNGSSGGFTPIQIPQPQPYVMPGMP